MTGVYSDCSNREIIIISVIVVVVIIIISTASSVTYRCGLLLQTVHWRSEGVRGVRANGRKLFLKYSRENLDSIISYVFACNKNKALQLQRVPILSMRGYNIDLYFKQALQFPKPKTKGRQI